MSEAMFFVSPSSARKPSEQSNSSPILDVSAEGNKVEIDRTRLKRAVFLDRDGVLNEAEIRKGKPYPPTDAKSMRIPPGTVEALARLKDHGYLLLVVTNQPDVPRGKLTRETDFDALDDNQTETN